MILYGGIIYDNSEQDRLLAKIEPYINQTLSKKTLRAETVISAIDRLGKEIVSGKYDELINSLQTDNPQQYKLLAAAMLSRENLTFKLKTELGNITEEYTTSPPEGLPAIKVKTMPLGVIFHIAAGNMDGLPAFSLAEGLLTGNINLLKLPQADNSLSLKIISQLIDFEPVLADYIFVFDTPSTDFCAMQRMAELADGICVWGSNATISAVRNLAPVGTKLIEWGHKLGFCYISKHGDLTDELSALAEHIAATKQLLCSSCQTIFIDTEDESDLHKFCMQFLPLLETATARHRSQSIGERAYLTLLHHTEYLEEIIDTKQSNEKEYRGNGCRLIVRSDSELELSPMMCCVLVKRLPKEKIVSTLRQKKGFLQTAGLICDPEKYTDLTELFSRCGITRITNSGTMSGYFSGEAHDGEYPLRRYIRTVNIEFPAQSII